MTEAMPFLQKYDITFLRPPAIPRVFFYDAKCISSLVKTDKYGKILFC